MTEKSLHSVIKMMFCCIFALFCMFACISCSHDNVSTKIIQPSKYSYKFITKSSSEYPVTPWEVKVIKLQRISNGVFEWEVETSFSWEDLKAALLKANVRNMVIERNLKYHTQ